MNSVVSKEVIEQEVREAIMLLRTIEERYWKKEDGFVVGKACNRTEFLQGGRLLDILMRR